MEGKIGAEDGVHVDEGEVKCHCFLFFNPLVFERRVDMCSSVTSKSSERELERRDKWW